MLTGNPYIVKDVGLIVSNSVTSEWWTVKKALEIRRKGKLNKQKKYSISSVKERTEDFSLKSQNQFSILHDKADRDSNELSGKVTKIVLKAAKEL